jgi:hypothetical protein
MSAARCIERADRLMSSAIAADEANRRVQGFVLILDADQSGLKAASQQ